MTMQETKSRAPARDKLVGFVSTFKRENNGRLPSLEQIRACMGWANLRAARTAMNAHLPALGMDGRLIMEDDSHAKRRKAKGR